MWRASLVFGLLAPVLVNGCSTSAEAPCGADRDCPSGACVAGRCTPPVDAEPADAEPADAEPADAEPADAEPADAEPADAAPETGDPDGGPGDAAPPEPCDGDPPRLARCDRFTLRTDDCVDGVWRRGPCRAVPPVPCGSVCEGCLPERPEWAATQRVAFRVPPGPVGFDDRYLGGFVEDACDGCNGFAEGLIDRRASRRLDGDARVVAQDCDGCAGPFDGDVDEREVWTPLHDGYRIERRASPDGPPTVDRFILAADGRVERLELDIIEDRPAGVAVWQYGPTGLWTGFEITAADGRPVSRTVARRDPDGAVIALDRYRGGIDPDTIHTFDLGCWRCADGRCALGAPDGCTHLPGAVPPVYVCQTACPDALRPAWFVDLFEARFVTRPVGDGALAFAVGARVVDGRFSWTHSDRPVDMLLFDPPVADDAPCAELTVTADDALALIPAPCDRSPVLCRAPETAGGALQ